MTHCHEFSRRVLRCFTLFHRGGNPMRSIFVCTLSVAVFLACMPGCRSGGAWPSFAWWKSGGSDAPETSTIARSATPQMPELPTATATPGPTTPSDSATRSTVGGVAPGMASTPIATETTNQGTATPASYPTTPYPQTPYAATTPAVDQHATTGSSATSGLPAPTSSGPLARPAPSGLTQTVPYGSAAARRTPSAASQSMASSITSSAASVASSVSPHK